jgi:glycosyltransferase involved in cell wall biosynthesis
LAKCARASSVFGDLSITVIPNGIDTKVFRPLERRFAREVLGLPQDRPLILFGAVRARDDPRKGYSTLQHALALLADAPSVPELVVFGSEGDPDANLGTLPIRFMGHIQDDITLALLYSAADVFVAPSIEENLSNVVMEALACGLPCAAFAVGGMNDLIDHRANGYLARPHEPEDLAAGITWILADEQRRSEMATAARKKVESNFSIDQIACRYLELYHTVLECRHDVPSNDNGVR